MLEQARVFGPVSINFKTVISLHSSPIVEFADEHPESEVLGIDLSPTQPAL